MHSRIFQLTKTKLEQMEHLDSSSLDYDHWFFHSVADYVADDDNRANSIEWLKESLTEGNPHIEWCDDSFILRDGFLIKSFSSRFECFKQQLSQLSEESTLEKFAHGGISQKMYNLSSFEEEEFGFYIYDELGSIQTLDSFIRHAELDVHYYIGGTVDYHY